LAVAGAFPAAAFAGLALDLAGVTPVPMTAVMAMGDLLRFLPRYPKWLGCLAPGVVYLMVMGLCNHWDLQPLPGLLIGGAVGGFLPGPSRVAHRRGETGAAQVRLELMAGVLAQTQQLLVESPGVPVDEEAVQKMFAHFDALGMLADTLVLIKYQRLPGSIDMNLQIAVFAAAVDPQFHAVIIVSVTSAISGINGGLLFHFGNDIECMAVAGCGIFYCQTVLFDNAPTGEIFYIDVGCIGDLRYRDGSDGCRKHCQ